MSSATGSLPPTDTRTGAPSCTPVRPALPTPDCRRGIRGGLLDCTFRSTGHHSEATKGESELHHIPAQNFQHFDRTQHITVEVLDKDLVGVSEGDEISISTGRGEFFQCKVLAIKPAEDRSSVFTEVRLEHQESY
jgi:hypothetical protein